LIPVASERRTAYIFASHEQLIRCNREMLKIKNRAGDIPGDDEDVSMETAMSAADRYRGQANLTTKRADAIGEMPGLVARQLPASSRAWQMARHIVGPLSVANSIYETVVSPNGTVRRTVRRDAVRNAARLAPSQQRTATVENG
jgi:hypothetical protein